MDIERIWKNTQEELKIILAPAVFQTFVAKTQLISIENNIAVIGCPNSYLSDINRKRYYELFKGALDNQTKTENIINFTVQEITSPKIEKNNTPPLLNFTYSSNNIDGFNSNLHQKYILKNLIVGNSNNFAYAAALGIIKNPGVAYNPFFIWGPPGVGKTHLMQAVGHELLKNNPSLKVKYFPAETFGNEAIAAMKTKNMEQFKKKYRGYDCILVDDIQFIAGKEYIQEEFFHTFNSLHMEGKQVILTSDRKPSEINNLSDRLVSRFLGGLTVDIQLPDFEMKTAIINQRLEEKGIKIDYDAASYLAQNINSNIRDIEGKVQEISVQAITKGTFDIKMDFINSLYKISEEKFLLNSNKLNSRHIISICSKFFNLKTSELCGKSRKQEIVFARHITAYLLLNEIKLPLKEVGNVLGGRDHTSIMHARDRITSDLSTNPQISELINNLKKNL